VDLYWRRSYNQLSSQTRIKPSKRWFLMPLLLGTFLWPSAATAQDGGGDFNIAAVGDWGCTDNTEDTVENILARNPEVVLGLGDNSYDESSDCWFETVDPIIARMITVIGNHDDKVHVPGGGDANDRDSPELLAEYMDAFGLQEQYYTYRYGNVFIVALSQEVPFKEGSDQYEFVERALASASSDPNIDWIIVMTHEMMYASPSATNDRDLLRNTYHPLIKAYNVDLVLQAHIHSYERKYPIEYRQEYGDDNPNFRITMSTETDTYVNPEGQIFATVGTGGQSIHSFGGKNPYIVTQFEGYGFLDIVVVDGGGEEKRLVGTFYDNDGGQIVDQFTVIKEDDDDDDDDDEDDENE
jgi:hypothetical protein